MKLTKGHDSDPGRPRQVLVDADACPRSVLRVLQSLQPEYGYQLVTVASFHHHIEHAQHVTVGDEPEAADLAVANRARPGDVVVTQDWGLAALVLGKGAHCLSPRGRVLGPENIEFLLHQRHLQAKHRRGGGRSRGPRARQKDDDLRFQRALRRVLEQA